MLGTAAAAPPTLLEGVMGLDDERFLTALRVSRDGRTDTLRGDASSKRAGPVPAVTLRRR
jgi:hypothetical protein